MANQKLSYSDKLKDPRWQKKRLEILERDNWTCYYCGDKETTLHVHHEEYEGNDPWDTHENLLKTICQNCHSTLHRASTPLEQYLLKCLMVRSIGEPEMIKIIRQVVKYIKEGNNG